MDNLSAQGAEESTQDVSVGGGPGETTVEGVSGAATVEKAMEKVENADPKFKAGKRKIADKAPTAKKPKKTKVESSGVAFKRAKGESQVTETPFGLDGPAEDRPTEVQVQVAVPESSC